MKRNTNIGSISHGTMRPEDLIPAFLSELRSQKPLSRDHRKLAREVDAFLKYAEDSPQYSTDTEQELLESLFDALDRYAPQGFYFGAHPGDGSDYGYWLSESFVDDFDGPKVSDSGELPKGFHGEYLIISDHGNVTLMVKYGNNRTVEIWGVV